MIKKTSKNKIALSVLFQMLFFVFCLSGLCLASGGDSPARVNKSKNDFLKDTQIRMEPFGKTYTLKDNSYMRKTLANGLKLSVREKPNSGVVGVEITIKAGSMEELDSYGGVTTLIQRLIMHGGGKDRFIPLKKKAEFDGCIIRASAGPDVARISLLTTPDKFRVNYKRIIEVLKHPDFSEAAVDKEKKQLIRDLQGHRTAYRSINELFLKQFYRYHPYRLPVYGSKATIKKLTPEVIREFYKRNYTANRISVAVVGDIQGRDVMQLSEKLLSDIPSRKISNVDIPWEPKGQEKRLHLAAYSNTAWLFVGFPAPSIKSPDYPKMKLLSTIIGEGMSSRLFMELREKEGLAYSLSSDYPRLEGPSHMVVFVVTTQRNLYRNRGKMFRIIRSIKKDGVTGEELEAAKRKVLAKFMMKRETCSQIAYSMAFYSAMGMGYTYDKALIDRINKVTTQDIRDVARKYLRNYTVLVVESIPPDRRGRDDD